MKQTRSAVPWFTKLIFAFISLVVGSIGVIAIYTGYAPEGATRFGLVGPLWGMDAHAFGFICLFLAALPLLVFARNKQQALIIGSSLGVLLVIMIFAVIYWIGR